VRSDTWSRRFERRDVSSRSALVYSAIALVLTTFVLSVPVQTVASAGPDNASIDGKWTVQLSAGTSGYWEISGENLSTGAFGGDLVAVVGATTETEPIRSGLVTGNTFTATLLYPGTVVDVNGLEYTVVGTIKGNTMTFHSTSIEAWRHGKAVPPDRISVTRTTYSAVREVILSVSEVTPSSSPLAVDVHVKLGDSSGESSDCDTDATYHFSDPGLKSTKELAPCEYELTFSAPGTGIYHVALEATQPSGAATHVSRDQYGDAVDGKFTVIVDSCSDPEQVVPDIDSLLNSDDADCDLEVGEWDSDAADVASRVIADAVGSASLEFAPVPVDSIDPSDWPVRGPTVPSGPGVGWLPTGVAAAYSTTPLDGEYPTGVGDAVALVQRLHVAGVPVAYDGGPHSGSDIPLDGVPPAKVISSHGWWYPPNGLELVPDGDTITTFVPIGTSMGEDLGVDIDVGFLYKEDKLYRHVYKSGDLMPNFSFAHLSEKDGKRGKYVYTIPGTTTLNAVLNTVKGTIWISACAPVYIPVGLTASSALKDLPVHSPGVETSDTKLSVQISSRGELVVAK
jgi:hypothetical protein